MAGNGAITAARELIEAFNANDWDRLRRAVATDLVYQETGTHQRAEGSEAYIKLCTTWKGVFPDLVGTVGRSAGDGEWAALEVKWAGTQSGPLEGPTGTVPASGRYGETRATLWARVRDGRVAEIDHHLDVLSLLANIGALPS